VTLVPPGAALFARTFVIGILVAAPVGAMGVLCIQRTLERGWRSGMATGAGIATADGIYAGLAAFGVAAVSARLVAWQTPLQLVGGVALVYLGVVSMRSRPPQCDIESGVAPPALDRRGAAALYGAAVGLTLTNPMTIMAFGAVFASAGLVAQPGATSAALATAGVAAGSLAWWLTLVTGVFVARRAVGPRLVAVVRRVSGGAIVAFGIVAIAVALSRLVR
jgi:putative LysE/RhtB family amino acid efflux pump